MKNYDSNRVMNGTYGEVWFDDEYLAEVEEAKAEVDITYSDVSRVRKLFAGKKMTKLEGKITIKLHHVRSNIADKVANCVKEGKTPSYKILIKLDDPDALGAERAVFYACKPSKITFFDWKAANLSEESYDFTFEDFDFLDKVEVH
jgi:hypothetical protein